MRRRYDFIIIGGGLAGASLATVMAGRGARVLVLEREARFKDRVRGEALLPWGAAELESLGLRMPLLSACGNENRWWDDFLAGERIGHRDTVSETPGGTATLTYETGPEADERRARALPLLAEEPDRVPDAFMSGPVCRAGGRTHARPLLRGSLGGSIPCTRHPEGESM